MDYVIYFLLIFAVTLLGVYVINNVLYYLQLNEYNYFKNIKNVVGMLSLEVILIYIAPLIVTTIFNLILRTGTVLKVFLLIETLAYFALGFVLSSSKSNRKVKLKITKRFSRLYVMTFIIFVLIVCYFCYKIVFAMPKLFSFIYLTPFVAVLSVLIAQLLLFPFEKAMYYYYLNDAVKKLKKHGGITNIAVTGSFGKTSTKFILKTILSEKYNVCATPNSYNTPMGITKTIREMLSPTHDIFIMEFGAKRKGEIKYLCTKFQPNIGVITNIGKAHMQSFKSIDNIMETKNELTKNLYGRSPYAVFNKSNKYVACCAKRCTYDMMTCGFDDANLVAKNIDCNSSGTSFDIFKDNILYVHVKTKLIGKHNVTNILLGVAVAIKMKLSKQQIINGVAKLRQVSARMEVMPHSSGAVIINNGYNSNPNSARSAVDTMDLFDKKNKIVLTPGMVEMGESAYTENYEFGKFMATKINKVFIPNIENAKALREGLIAGGFDVTNIVMGVTVSDVFKTLTKDDVLLIENDLPDNYK